jgi:hypothetical protein
MLKASCASAAPILNSTHSLVAGATEVRNIVLAFGYDNRVNINWGR